MLRLALVAALCVGLVACATNEPATPCVSTTVSDGCPVYKAPEDALGPCRPSCTEPAPAPAAPVALAVEPFPQRFLPWAEGYSNELRLVIGDEVRITLPFYEDEDVTTIVAPDGNIYLELIGAVSADGRTPTSLESDLEARYAEFLRFPDVGVVPSAFASRQVFVGGEVKNPGVYPLAGPTGVLEAVYQAGGFLDTARQNNVALIRRGPNRLPMLRYLDLASFSKDGVPTENTLLAPFDIVVVPKSNIAKVNLFVEQYINNVVPFSHNFGYNLIDLNPG